MKNKNKNIDEKMNSMAKNSDESRDAKNGYMERGNAGKISAEQGTKHKK